MRITAVSPEALISDANHFAMCLALSEADGKTYRNLNWKDAAGNLYAAASFEAREEWVIAAQSVLSRPEWDVNEVIDMQAAERAQAALIFVLEPVLASPENVTAIGGIEGPDALIALGLSPVEIVEEFETDFQTEDV